MRMIGMTLAAVLMTAQGTAVVGQAPPLSSSQEYQDNLLLVSAMTAVGQGGYPALDPMLPALRKALARAPEQYPSLEFHGDRVRVRADEMGDYLALAAAAIASARRRSGATVTAERRPNVYPDIAVLLASEAVARRRYAEALGYTDRGMQMQPHLPGLVLQRALALQGMGRHDAALAFLDAELAARDTVLDRHRGAVLRKRGFSLIELGRLDEARAAYEESLEAEPDNPVAGRELDYIAGLLAGAAAGSTVFESPGPPKPR